MASDPSQQDKKPHAVPARPPPPDEALRCPRCDSSNTKFCYYNNYSLTQPRYFCKTCRRHWTKGGALRNVPIGGGCRKNKKAKTDSRLPIIYCGEDKDSSSSGMRLLHGISSSLNHNQFFPFGDLSSPAIGTSAFDSGAVTSSSEGLRYPLSKVARLKECEVHVGEAHEFGPTNIHSNIGTSIEDLSYMNQDLHWKLQQQRLAMLFSGKCKETGANSQGAAPQSEGQKMPSFAFQAMGQPNELFYGNSSTLVNGSNIGNKSSSWNGIQSCNDLHRYSALQ